ncbi:fimbria/pilus outer membrane usher protein (plasmid) [Salmonella enterica subsp. enterica serovar 4,[5],12:i:-]
MNDVTVNTGLTTAPRYAASLAGVAFNTPLGAIATDVTFSRTILPGDDITRKGYSLHTSYSVMVPSISTSLTLAAYRYMSKDFYNLRDAMCDQPGRLFREQSDRKYNALASQKSVSDFR